jgi:hypothetical protein
MRMSHKKREGPHPLQACGHHAEQTWVPIIDCRNVESARFFIPFDLIPVGIARRFLIRAAKVPPKDGAPTPLRLGLRDHVVDFCSYRRAELHLNADAISQNQRCRPNQGVDKTRGGVWAKFRVQCLHARNIPKVR